MCSGAPMKTIAAHGFAATARVATITPTKELKIQLPDDIPVGTFNVVLVIDETTVVQAPPTTDTPSPSFLELAGELIGSLDGLPPDLSTNPRYMEGFGES